LKKVIFIIAALILMVTGVYAAESVKLNPDSSKECAVCHYEWMPQFLFELKGTDLVDYQAEKTVATEKMCFSCHNGTVGDSRIKIWSGDMHKLVEKIPEHITIPSNFPLDNGAIGCKTCHTAHATGDPQKEGVARGIFLRVENEDSQLCRSCHKDVMDGKYDSHPLKAPENNHAGLEITLNKMGGRFGSKGQVICESCHTPHSPKEKKLLISQESDSRLCSVCHDDKVNIENAAYLKGMLNHPINVTHMDDKCIKDTLESGGIYGENFEVICITCHNVHKGKTKSLLIMKNNDSKLCIKCHEKKKTIFKTKHDMLTLEGFKTKDGKTAQEKGTCESCHAPHGWSMKLPKQGEDMISKGCLSCHDENGVAPKKVISSDKFNHPVGKSLKEGMTASETLPLFGKIAKFLTELHTDGEVKTLVTCATCHDVHSSDKNFLRKEASTGALCLTCHNEKEMVNKTNHGIEKLDKSCLSCHKVHNSENKRLLIKPEDDGCLDCHKTGGSGEKKLIGEHSHPVNIDVTRKLDDHFKLTKDGKMTCVTCHDPHKPTKTAKLDKDFIRGGFENFDTFCSACHENNKEIVGSDHDVRKADTESVCIQCHTPHNAKSASNIMSLEYKYTNKDDGCKVCHNEKGTADKKVVMDGHKLGKIEMHEKYGKFLTEEDGDYYLYCSGCHTVHNNGPKKGEEGTIQNSFLNKKLSENGNFCAGCHEDKKSFAQSKHNVEKFEKNTPATTAKKAVGDTCGSCHIVHNSGPHLFDKAFGNDFEKMCTSCHVESGVADKTKINTSHKMGVKLKKEMKIFLQDGNVVCATCHQPHGVENGMLRDMGEKNICLACHEEQKMVALTEHNMALIDYMDADHKKTAEDNVCYTCHKPHNFHKNNKYMWAFEPSKKTSFAFELCTDCHKKDGVGYKKIPEALTHDKIFKIFPYKEKFKDYLYSDAGEVSADGSIACSTCHNPHVWKKGMNAPEVNVEGDAKNSFLKLDVKTGFCSVCHGEERAENLFSKYHDKEFRQTRNKKIGEAEVMKNLFMLQMNIQKFQEK